MCLIMAGDALLVMRKELKEKEERIAELEDMKVSFACHRRELGIGSCILLKC